MHIQTSSMSSTSSGHDVDLESQQTVLLIPGNSSTARERWRWILLILQQRNLISRADKAHDEKRSPSFDTVSSSSTSYYSIISNIDGMGEMDQQTITGVEISTASPQVLSMNVSLDSLDGENGNRISRDAKLQQENISKMVKDKDMDCLQKFGGIQGIAEALDTNLENGIRGDEEDLRSRRITASTLSATTQTSARSFLQILLKSCNSYIIFLLFVYAVLSLGFGITEEGHRTGWYEGFIILLAIVVLVVVPALRDVWLKHSQTLTCTGNKKALEMWESVDVFRGGRQQKVSICDVLPGDIVCLESEYLVPADGLFISSEFLKLTDGSEFIVDKKNPFLFYGAKVTEGTGRMLVTAVGMDTTWGHLMKQGTHAPKKTPLPAELDKVNSGIQITGLSISILILVVLFLRFKLEKEEDVDSSLPELRGKPISCEEIINVIKRIVLKPNGKISTLTTSVVMSLVGLMEGIPFVITLAITYWNKKELSDKAIAQEPLACLAMASVTTICLDKTSWLTLNPMAVDLCFTEMLKEIEAWRNAGFNIILVSEDNVSGSEVCEGGLLPDSNRMVLEGEKFLNHSEEDRMNIVDKITVMRSSFPSDRLRLVQCLKKKGHKVAMIGVKTNEIPVLKEADVGIVIDTCSSEMARKGADIIIRGGDFNFLVTIVSCGKCTYDNIRKYIQLVLTMNAAGLLTSLLTTICFGNSSITSVQLLWANFVVALLGGLALLTEPPTGKLMDMRPLRRTKPLITKPMWRNLGSQVLYQVAILMAFQFKGQAILHISEKVSKTIIFNSFVLCQVFNQVNARELEKKNAFRGIHRNILFWVAVGVTLVLQVAFIEIAHIVSGCARLNLGQWLVCLLIGVVSWTIDCITKCTSGYIRDWLIAPINSHMGVNSMTPSAPSEPTSNLELPLINENSTPISS
ncbi:hypothetical protein CIPAW_09G105200 [Carya illinoinensis]|uniref:Calcium-transporting ATPase n=1 Tax=Carya illinoinensis TaxID=32201 RepID=A0A8T1PJJ3_CARIL|nr:hypothetical protein CIPAW_09G105200 [Carya illinoinensis]KAG6641892.1 hypothetical protein CIPAW_09G105200 [Carya illinoinensis]KAG6641893.1 hypothetical protein CIPAW_09G105200 [Carya illinoinensis]KAG6695536.1 hypothetical protein I3842_09G102800 [Carya illinoinensis]KAG6695537.1 hypothetical protein I3842_09G102800 [Carya illinoinensis]